MPAWVAYVNVCCAPLIVGDLLESNYRSRDSYETRERGEVGAAMGLDEFARSPVFESPRLLPISHEAHRSVSLDS